MVAISEKEFQNKVIALAIMYGWRVTHFRASQVGGKWMTAIQGDPGFPDLVMAHKDKGLVFAELKTERGRLDPAQHNWLGTLAATGAEAYCWRPSDMQFITNRLLQKALVK
jgi:hypothetical protein